MRKKIGNRIYASFFVCILIFSACENDIINSVGRDIPIDDYDAILGVWRSLDPVEKTPEESDLLFIHIEQTAYRMSFHDKNGFYDTETPLIPYVIDGGFIQYVSPDNIREELPFRLEDRDGQKLLRLTAPVLIYFERINDPINPAPVIYRIFYEANGASGGNAPVDETEYTGGAQVILAGQEDLFRIGYVFMGWSTKEEGDAEYQPGESIILQDQGITLYAVWNIRPADTPTYTITYDGNGFTSGPDTVPRDTNPYAEGDPLRIALPGGLEKSGYDFVGWNISADETGTAIFAEDIIEVGHENITLYAVWSTFTFKTITVDGVDSLSITGYKGTDTEIAIPELINTQKVTAIDNGAFNNSAPGNSAKRLTKVTLPPIITTIGDYAFADNHLAELILPEGLTAIGQYAFYNNQLTTIRIPDTVLTIGERAFLLNTLTTLDLGNRIEFLGIQAFSTNQLTSVTLPPSLTTMGLGVFYRNDLISITLGANLDFDSGAFGLTNSSGTGSGDLFLAYYTANGKQAGTYAYSAGQWVKSN